MTKLLTNDEMLDLLGGPASADPEVRDLIRAVEVAGQKLAAAIVAKYPGILAGRTVYEGTAFAGTCTGFYLADASVEPPPIFADYDAGEELEVIN